MIAELIISGLLAFTGISADGTIWILKPLTEDIQYESAIGIKLDMQNSSISTASPELYQLNTNEKVAEVYPLLGCPAGDVAEQYKKIWQ